MEKERATYLFQRYINRKCSPAELAEFMAQLRKTGDDDIIEMVMDKYWDESEELVLEEKIANDILNQVISTGSSKSKKAKSGIIKLWMGWAAAVLLIVTAALIFVSRSDNPQLTETYKNKPQLTSQLQETIVVKTAAEHQKVTLPDGSTVVLNTNTMLSYTKDFNNNNRAVLLDGEGYFDIKHSDKKTFTVYTGELRTIVLGTAFNINAYKKNKRIEVTVTRGKVGVLNTKATLVTLTANQQMVFNKNDKKSSRLRVAAEHIVQWQENDLFFDDTSMEQAAEILSKRFNTAITFTNEGAKKCRFSATFLKGESFAEILKLICSYNNAQYQSNASGITIEGRGCE